MVVLKGVIVIKNVMYSFQFDVVHSQSMLKIVKQNGHQQLLFNIYIHMD